MARYCSNCDKQIGFFETKYYLKNGYLCDDCFQDAFQFKAYNNSDYWDAVESLHNIEADDIHEYLISIQKEKEEKKKKKKEHSLRQRELSNRFRPTIKIPKLLEIDNLNSIIKVNEHFFSFNQLIKYQLYEDGANYAEGGIGRAVIGDIVFGSIGAIVGAETRSHKDVCNNMSINISFDDSFYPVEVISIINSEINKTSRIYTEACKEAREIISHLDVACHQNNKGDKIEQSSLNTSIPDEIAKYKQLLDIGAITKEEFETAKKKLLNSI